MQNELQELGKIHGAYKLKQISYLASLYDLIGKNYNLSELACIGRNELKRMVRQAYSMLDGRGYGIPQLRATKALSRVRGK